MKIKVGISGDLLNEDNEPCFGNEALLILENRDDIEIKTVVEPTTQKKSIVVTIKGMYNVY